MIRSLVIMLPEIFYEVKNHSPFRKGVRGICDVPSKEFRLAGFIFLLLLPPDLGTLCKVNQFAADGSPPHYFNQVSNLQPLLPQLRTSSASDNKKGIRFRGNRFEIILRSLFDKQKFIL